MNRSATAAVRRRLVVLSALSCAAILVSPPGAGAQSAVDQYVPEVDKGGASRADGPAAGGGQGSGPGGGAPGTASKPAAAQPTAAEVEGGDSGGGSAGGFPMTTFVTVIAGLLILALLGRVLVPALRGAAGSIRGA
jgi:hypothetical protein